ncbi:MAG: HAD family hydrolase [Ostreibacterium sp.]
MLKTINAVIFDMDGIIFDSEKVHYDAFFIAADEYEIEVSNDFVQEFSGKSQTACELMLQNLFNNNVEKIHHFFRTWGKARLSILAEQGLDFKDGFLNLFDAIQASGREVGLVTSASRTQMEENFRRNNSTLFESFKHVITIDDVKYPKPHPQPYQMMMRRLSQSPENCLVIEDSIPGVSASTAAGISTIMLNEYIMPPPELADKILFHTQHHDDILVFLQDNGL